MVEIAGIILLGLLAAAVEVPVLLRKNWGKELWVFVLFLLLSMVISIAQALKLALPNPLELIAFVLRPISSAITNLFK